MRGDDSKKSLLPDLNEITHIASKLFGDLKKSLSEIQAEYQSKRAAKHAPAPAKHQEPAAKKAQTAKKSPHETPADKKASSAKGSPE